MRHLLVLLLLLQSPWLVASAKDFAFPPALEELIEKYGKTEKPMLPEPEAIERLDDKKSIAPGTVPLTHNVIISKRQMRLYVTNIFGDTLATYPVCCARNRGTKEKKDDNRTPEGTFAVAGIYNSTDWKYKGTGAKCYGPYFISLITPGFWGIGIHGTNAPGSIPGRSSHGCIRVHNEDIVKIRSMVDKDSKVTVLPDDPEEEAAQIKLIKDSYTPPVNTALYTYRKAIHKTATQRKIKKSADKKGNRR